MDEYWEGTFADLARTGALLFGDGYRTKRTELGNPGFPIVRVAQVENGRIRHDEIVDSVRADFRSAIGAKLSELDDVILTTKGTFGRRARVLTDATGLVYSPQVCFFRVLDRSVVDPRFLYFWLGSSAFAIQAMGLKSQTDMADYLSLRDLAGIRVRLPPIEEQRRIARILGALDDKIELNRELSSSLESMGRATYSAWRAGQPRVAFATIGEVCRVLSGGTPTKSLSHLWLGAIPWISPKVMTAIHCDEPDAHVSEKAIGNGTRIAPAGTTLVMVRGMGLHDGVRVSQARVDVAFNQDVKALVPEAVEPALLLFAVLDAQESLHQKVEASGHGTGVLSTSVLTNLRIPMPRGTIRRQIAQRLADINDRIGVTRDEVRTLTAIRDTLLPRLTMDARHAD